MTDIPESPDRASIHDAVARRTRRDFCAQLSDLAARGTDGTEEETKVSRPSHGCALRKIMEFDHWNVTLLRAKT